MKKLLLFLCLLAYSSYSQDIIVVDSLLKHVDLNDSSNIHEIVRALQISKTIEYEKGEAKAYHCLGFMYNVKGNFPLSMEKFIQADQIYKSIGDNEARAHVHISMAYLYNRLKDHEKEITCANEAIRLSKKDSIKAYGYNCIGRGKMALGKTEESIESFTKAIKIKEDAGEVSSIYDFLNSLGNAYIKAKMYDSALVSFWKMHRYAQDRPKILARMFNNIGTCHHLKSEYQMAELNYLESIALSVKEESGQACLNYAELLHHIGQPEKAKSYLAKGLSYNYDLGHLGRTLFAMELYKESSLVRDCLYVHATKDFEKLRANSVTVATIESDLRNAREKAALQEASDWKGKMLWTWLAISLVAIMLLGKYLWDSRFKIKAYQNSIEKIEAIVKKI